MRLSIKNLTKKLSEEYSVCLMCGDTTEICAYGQTKDKMTFKIFCNSCGTNIDLFDILKEIEKEKIEEKETYSINVNEELKK